MITGAYFKPVPFHYGLLHAILFFASGFFANEISEEYTASNKMTFCNADLQVTAGVYCIKNTVMYKVRDSIHQVDYPLQALSRFPNLINQCSTPIVWTTNLVTHTVPGEFAFRDG